MFLSIDFFLFLPRFDIYRIVIMEIPFLAEAMRYMIAFSIIWIRKFLTRDETIHARACRWRSKSIDK